MSFKPSPPNTPDISGSLTADASIQEVNEIWPDLNQIAYSINLVLRGRMNVGGALSLTASATSTTITDNLFQSSQVPILVPATESAANATVWISERENGQFVIGHDSTADTDREFLYVRIG